MNNLEPVRREKMLSDFFREYFSLSLLAFCRTRRRRKRRRRRGRRMRRKRKKK